MQIITIIHYIQRDNIDFENNPIGAFQKPIALLKHIHKHDYIIWLDSDMLIMNMDIVESNNIAYGRKKKILAYNRL